MNRRYRLCVLLIAALSLTAVASPPAAHAVDLDGNQVDDLVIGVPYEAIDTATTAGAVHALYGMPGSGLGVSGSQLWYQGLPGVLETAEAGDEFGFALAVADWNRDGYRDLAVGVHGEAVGSIPRAGAVHVFYGTADGLAAQGNQLLHQGIPALGETAEADDRFGWSLAAGDFDGDGYGDLAVGVLWEDVGDPAIENAGAVHVIYGSGSGLTTAGSQVWYAGQDGVQGPAAANDQFGQALATGDLNRDGHEDLVIGVPLAGLGGYDDCGLLHVLYGSDAGLSGESDEVWYQGWLGGLVDVYAEGDHFAQSLVTGDLNRDGYGDLAVGVPYKDTDDPAVSNAGAVHFVYGSADGLTSEGNWLLFQPAAGPVAPEADDNLGASLASGDFDGNGFADVAAGVPGEEDSPAKSNAGAVMVVYFPNTPVVLAMWDQDDAGIQDLAEAGDGFGSSLAAGDFDGDGHADLAVGVPWEDILDPVVTNAGAVQVLYGSAGGLAGGNDDFWHQGIDGIAGGPEAEDRFGLSLAASLRVRHKVYLPVVVRRF